MGNEEFTTEELKKMFEKFAQNGKISIDDVGKIVFDSSFPEHLFPDAKDRLIQFVAEEKRYKELAQLLLPKTQQLQQILKEISDRKQNLDDSDENIGKILELETQEQELEAEIKPLEEEFNSLKEVLEERKKG